MAFFFQDFLTKNGQKLRKTDRFSSKIAKKLLKSVKNTPDFPEKKCHLIWKIDTFFGNFDPPFSEKCTFSVKSPKKAHVPN